MNTLYFIIIFACFVILLVCFFIVLAKYRSAKKENASLRDSTKLLTAEYVCTSEDFTKYKTPEAMDSAIKTKLAMKLANEIIKFKGSPIKSKDVKGNKYYEYIIKIL